MARARGRRPRAFGDRRAVECAHRSIRKVPMNISMYQASTPRFVNTLKNLSAILDKAQAYAEAKKIEPTVLTNCRLFPDMLPMKRQGQIAGATAKCAVARLAGVEVPKHEDTEETF